jgi:3-(3-hydroxy-phenyl)propionate hydroxylase
MSYDASVAQGDPGGYELRSFEFRRPPELDLAEPPLHPVVIVGAGLAGLTLALDLSSRGVPAVVLEQAGAVGAAGIASRGLAYSKRTLEIFDRLGVAERVAAKGVTWRTGRIYDGFEEIYHFQIEPELNQKWPPFTNLQQNYIEEFLVERIGEVEGVDLRWHSRVAGAEVAEDGVVLTVETPEGEYRTRASWVAACDGARSSMRRLLGIKVPVAQFEDVWAIIDVRVDRPELLTERRFWLNLPTIDGGAAIMHRGADGIIRVDWQISQLDDPELELTPDRVQQRLHELFGQEVGLEIVSVSKWAFRRRLMDRLVHGRVVFAGDAAHEIPPFGARGGNSGVQDAENLAWKLAAILDGRATPELLASYERERLQAAHEHAGFSCGSQVFITPTTRGGQLFRDAVMSLARSHDFARALVNTGRPSTATSYADSPLSVVDEGGFEAGVRPGHSAENGPLDEGFLLDRWRGNFTALYFVEDDFEPVGAPAEVDGFPLDHVVVRRSPATEHLFDRYEAAGGACYVLRPDAHVAGRSRSVDPAVAGELVARSLAQGDPVPA